MKLAELLARRAEIQSRLTDLKARAIRSAKVQDGQKPAESVNVLVEEASGLFVELRAAIVTINATNIANDLMEQIADRDMATLAYGFLRGVADAGIITPNIHTKSEVRFVETFNVKELLQRADRAARQRREIDTKLQEANWHIDIEP